MAQPHCLRQFVQSAVHHQNSGKLIVWICAVPLYAPYMPREATQEKGRSGVKFTRRWLEATTFVELQWDSYNNEEFCILPLLKGEPKAWDLSGSFLLENRQRVFVENKAEDTAGHQTAQFREFLSNSYSSTAKQWELIKKDPNYEYFWVTTHPFGTTSNWASLVTKKSVIDAVTAEDALPENVSIDEDLAALVATRIWVLVASTKQERLTLERAELDKVLLALERKKDKL